MSGGVPRRLQYLPQGNEDKLLLKSILCLKRRSCLHPPALYSVWTARSKYYSGITMNSNYPRQWNQWKHWAKWHRLGGKGDLLWHFLIFSSLKCNKQTFTVPSASKTFLEKHCQNKTPRPTSLPFMLLVPGAYRVVHHICIRCMHLPENVWKYMATLP